MIVCVCVLTSGGMCCVCVGCLLWLFGCRELLVCVCVCVCFVCLFELVVWLLVCLCVYAFVCLCVRVGVIVS